jgi:hypothetical protein
LSKVKRPKGSGESKSFKKGLKKSRKTITKDDSESEEMSMHYESEENEDKGRSNSEDEKESEGEIRSRNVHTNENELDGIEESNLDERTHKRSSIPAAMSASLSKKRSHSLSSEPRRVPPSKRYETASLMSKKSHKSSRESSHSIKNKKITSSSISPQVGHIV